MAWNTRYPIGRLITEAAASAGLGVNELVRRAGYRNLDKGRRRLAELLAHGNGPAQLLKGLRQALSIEPQAWKAALVSTREQTASELEAAARERFRPYIYVMTRPGERRMPAFAQAFTANQLLLKIPEEWRELPPRQVIQRAGRLVAKHFRDNEGELTTHGIIVGYRVHVTYVHAVDVGPDGAILDGYADAGADLLPTLTIKGKAIPPGLFEG